MASIPAVGNPINMLQLQTALGGTVSSFSNVTTTAGANSIIAGGATSTNYTGLQASANTPGQFIMYLNGSARTTDGGTLTGTIRNDTGGDLRFVNVAGNGLYVLGSAGFCGINNAAPTFALDVNGSARVTGSITAAGNSLRALSGKSYLYNSGHISNSAGAVTDVGTGNVGVIFTAGGALDLVNANNTSMVRILGANVGINNTNPQYTLDVNGNARVTNTLLIGSQPAQKALRVWTGGIQGPFTGDWGVTHATVNLAGGMQIVEYSYSAFVRAAGNMGIALCMPPGGSYRGVNQMYCNAANYHTTAPTKFFQFNFGAGSYGVNFYMDIVQYGNMTSDSNDFLYWRITEYPA